MNLHIIKSKKNQPKNFVYSNENSHIEGIGNKAFNGESNHTEGKNIVKVITKLVEECFLILCLFYLFYLKKIK